MTITTLKSAVFALSISSSLVVCPMSLARNSSAPADFSLQNPIYRPLPSGAGPETNDSRDADPTVLSLSPEETDKTSAELTNEELGKLWEAALANSQDIQFIIEKLTPKKTSIEPGGFAKDLGRAMYGCVLAGEGVASSPNQSAGTSLIMGVLSDTNSKIDKKSSTKQSDAIMLYKMIRDTAHKLTTTFYNYKKYMNILDRANLDMLDLTAMVSNTREKLDPSRQLELGYLLRKQARDIESLQASMNRYHKELIVLCGKAAVDNLDTQLAENISLSRRTAIRVVKPIFTQPDEASVRD